MRKALLVSNHALLNDLYTINLKIYVDTEVNICGSFSELDDYLNSQSEFDLIITLSNFDEVDGGELVFNKIKELGFETPFVIIGEKSKLANTNQVTTLPANYNIKFFLRNISKILGVTAKEMAEKEVPEFYPIPLKLFLNFIQTNCDIYHKVSKSDVEDEFVLILAKGSPVKERVREYADKGITSLFIPASDRLNFINMASSSVIENLKDESLSNDKKVEATEQGFELIADSLTKDKVVSGEMVAISKACIKSVKDVIKSEPRLKALLLSMVENKTRFIYLHSILATYVSNHIISNVSWGADEHAEKVSFCLFFHDMCLIPLYNKYPDFKYEEDLLFNSLLSDQEKEVVLNHARIGGEIVKTFPKCPMGADAIVTQHHGTTNGVGFAIEYKDDVSPLAKVIIVSEEYVDQLMKQKDNGFYDHGEILAHLHGKFTKHTYKKIINTLDNLQL